MIAKVRSVVLCSACQLVMEGDVTAACQRVPRVLVCPLDCIKSDYCYFDLHLYKGFKSDNIETRSGTYKSLLKNVSRLHVLVQYIPGVCMALLCMSAF